MDATEFASVFRAKFVELMDGHKGKTSWSVNVLGIAFFPVIFTHQWSKLMKFLKEITIRKKD